MSKTMKITLIALCFVINVQLAFSQQQSISSSSGNPLTAQQQQIIKLSKDKWQWMADKNIDKLAKLFHDKSKFVHMSGTWKKNEELDIIKTGRIWYKKADIHDVAAEIIGDNAIIWNRITLTAVVRGADAVTEFTVTEVYKKQAKHWKLLALTFSSVRDSHTIKH